MAGQFMWFDLGATDAGQAREFYRALFGWAVAPAADAGPYQAWITDGEQPWAGIVHADTEGGGWLPYVMVQDLDEAAERAVSLTPAGRGGRIGPRTCSGQARRKGRSCGL